MREEVLLVLQNHYTIRATGGAYERRSLSVNGYDLLNSLSIGPIAADEARNVYDYLPCGFVQLA